MQKAFLDSGLTLMMSSEPAVVADHAFTTGLPMIRRAIAEFRAIDPKYIIVGHCTGDRFYDLARAELGDKVVHSAVGTRFVFTGGL
jgi:metal-dependent hydrolase (beta-lactamase superfamily II)